MRKLLRRLDSLEARLDAITSDEKRIVDLIVRLTTDHVGRQIREVREDLDEKAIVEALARAVVHDVEKMIDRKKLEVNDIADAVLAGLRDREPKGDRDRHRDRDRDHDRR
ncbi:MAG: hypothetical protein AAGE52_23010 [Myxococcota bacterium]